MERTNNEMLKQTYDKLVVEFYDHPEDVESYEDLMSTTRACANEVVATHGGDFDDDMVVELAEEKFDLEEMTNNPKRIVASSERGNCEAFIRPWTME